MFAIILVVCLQVIGCISLPRNDMITDAQCRKMITSETESYKSQGVRCRFSVPCVVSHLRKNSESDSSMKQSLDYTNLIITETHVL